MIIIAPSFEILDTFDGNAMLRKLEHFARVCYKSEASETDTSAAKFIMKIIESGHESVIEHEKVSVRLICDRGVSHEIVRHRIASYSQESTRYCNYSQNRFGNQLTFIRPLFWNTESEEYMLWLETNRLIEKNYLRLIELGAKPEEARSILPNSTKTEIVITMNLREWRHFFKLRTSKRAHPQMQEISIPLLSRFQELIPVIFDDINP